MTLLTNNPTRMYPQLIRLQKQLLMMVEQQGGQLQKVPFYFLAFVEILSEAF